MDHWTKRRQYILFFAWLVALVATLASLYFSEVLAMPVCHLCWYQRVCIYPLTIILGIAAFKNDSNVFKYALPLAVIGALFAAYQYLSQMIPGFSPINFCHPGDVSCSQIHIKWLGFITFPFLSLLACIAIILLLMLSYRK